MLNDLESPESDAYLDLLITLRDKKQHSSSALRYFMKQGCSPCSPAGWFGVFPFAPLGGREDQKQLRAHISVSVSEVTVLVHFSPKIKMKLKADLEDLHHLNKLKQGWYV